MMALIMKVRLYGLIACLLVMFQNVFAQKSHPYLFYTPQRVIRLKERIKTDTLLGNRWKALKQSCDEALNKPKAGNIEELAFAYNVTGDNRYAEKAKSLLIDMVNKPSWGGMDDRTPRWNADLNTGHADWTISVTFDAIYNSLSKEERKDIAGKIAKLGIEPSIADWVSKDKRIQSLNNMGHNWWSAIVFEAGIASLAVMNEIPQAKQWATDIMDDSKEWFAFSGSVLENKVCNFDPNGGFYESINYANFGVSEYLLFR